MPATSTSVSEVTLTYVCSSFSLTAKANFAVLTLNCLSNHLALQGIESVPEGLEDVSKYPALFAELIRRGWTDEQLEALAGGNTLRILEGVEKVREEMKAEKASMGRYLRRKDL